MDSKTVAEILKAGQIGQTFTFTFKPGVGREHTITQEDQVALIRFMAMTGASASSDVVVERAFEVSPMDSMLLYTVATSGYWSHIKPESKMKLIRHISDIDFFAPRVAPLLVGIQVV